MGYDAACTLTFDRQSSRGTALLEHKELLFRGPVRLAIPLAAVTRATAKEGTLVVEFTAETNGRSAKRSAEFTIGTAAEKWAKRITSPPSRLDKLGIKPGMTVAMLGVDDEPFLAELNTRGVTVTTRKPAASKPVDLVFYRADDRAALEALAGLAKSIKPAGALWLLRPKGRKEISESDTMAAGKRAGLVDIKVVSFSEVYSVEKYVVPVAKRPRS